MHPSTQTPQGRDTMTKLEKVILVDEQDRELGQMEKMQAHREGRLHRAFSIFLFNSQGEMLLQRRADHKYHSGGLWTNTCCSHPRAGESVEEAAKRRLMEEMGMQAPIQRAFSFIYRAELDQGLTEHELDHVLIGHSDDPPQLNPEEVAEWRYITTDDLLADVQARPSAYTEWFKIVLQQVMDWLKKES